MIYTDLSQIPMFAYRVIYADPPWAYENWSESGAHKNASAHYDCMDLEDIKAMNVGHLVGRDGVLFLWVTNPMLPQGLEVMAAWGFQFKAVGFTWAKCTKQGLAANPVQPIPDDFNWRMNNGYWTRQNTEMCLIGVMGDIARNQIATNVRELVIAPLGDHSQKPPETYDRIERLVHGPYLELFGRNEREGWDTFGNEVGKYEKQKAVVGVIVMESIK